MPELPEVETTRLGILPHIHYKNVSHVTIRQGKLRWPVPEDLSQTLSDLTVLNITRRAKYLLLHFSTGVLLIHLGMSGSLRFLTSFSPPKKHDHIDIQFTDGSALRYHDPRRFGSILWFAGAPEHHPLLQKLGPEPLENHFNTDYLYNKLKTQSRSIKLAIMDNSVVVGVGNIYANESLFRSKILPTRVANKVTKKECALLVQTIKMVLQQAIALGGSTLRDFVDSNGQAGYFQQTYKVYGRKNQTCFDCGHLIEEIKLGQRASFFCPICQK
ncbi:bifunctional DNA-formamidopyrimidine glycosylase/DNA-(apurinic or apyrimidinic site) lyase [Neisseria sp. Ec49-e6-T10]|uniref:bifunctional DNA-formamidopyrimidine glycosylase/DNA-(apurinic or apyrimidinic site) lyase n=1 Tax=Neisseria sp. Ec49-e6-T10 TaxID=3140744 RepID=UPI003EB8E438